MHTKSAFPDDVQSRAAGMVEGFLTADLILMHWKNNLVSKCAANQDLCDKIKQFFEENSIFVANGIDSNPQDKYWYQVLGNIVFFNVI